MLTLNRMIPLLFLLTLVPFACTTVDPEGLGTQVQASSSITDELAARGGSGVADMLEPYRDFIDAEDVPLALPDDPIATLITATATLSAQLGLPQDPTSAILTAVLEPTLAGRLANVLRALDDCTRTTQTALAGENVANLLRAASVDASRFADVPRCAKVLAQAARDLERQLGQIDPLGTVAPVALDLWPVLYLDRAGVNNLYEQDYLLIADRGGNDTYANNAGSNVIDINFAPETSLTTGLRGRGPARGCQLAINGFADTDCIVAAAVLVDLEGQDRYGVKQSPDVDARCTDDPVIRRMLTNGVGLAGVGILLDGAGNDMYLGKTVSNGAGHLSGIGILWDRSGADTYSSVRNSHGFGLVGGFGLLRDQLGNDTYDYDMPTGNVVPLPDDEEDGAGGVVDDEPEVAGVSAGAFCDRTPRFTAGAANFTGVGLLIENAGNDQYRGAFSPDFGSPAPIAGRTGSLGFANNGSFGALVDTSGVDTYTTVDLPGGDPRHDETVIAPDPTCVNSACTGLFVDTDLALE